MGISFLMPSRTVLLIADEALYIYSTGYKGVSLIEAIPWNADNFENNVAGIISRDCGGRPVLIVNDMVEQHYRKERVQKGGVGVLDKSSMLKRKLNVAFPNYPIRASFRLKEKIAKSANSVAADLYIFAAVPSTESFAKTLGATRKSLAPIVGFCLLPVESSDMVKMLAAKIARKGHAKSKWAIFIGQHQNGGLRQIVTRNGELALTRMTPIIDTDADSRQWAQEVNQEFKATMSYLSRFGYAQSDGLDVILISNPEPAALLEDIIDTPCSFTSMDVQEAARILNVPLGAQDDLRYADPLHVAWAGRKTSFILPMKARQIDEISQPRKAALAASFILLLSGAFLGYQLFNSYREISAVNESLSDSQRRKNQLDVSYQREVKRKEDLGYDIRLIQSSLAVYEELESRQVNPLRVYEALGRALGRNLKIDQIKISRKSSDPVNRVIGQFDQVKLPLYHVNMQMTFPSTTNIDKGNREVQDLRDRLQVLLPDHMVKVTKALKDYNYNEQIVVETGDLQKQSVQQDFVAEISIEGPAA